MGTLRIITVSLLFGSLWFHGCRSEPPCDKLARRNRVCVDAFLEEAKTRTREAMEDRYRGLSPEERKKAEAQIEASFAKGMQSARETLTSDEFLNDCRRDWNDSEKMPAALKKELDRCLGLPECSAYAACFMNSAELSP